MSRRTMRPNRTPARPARWPAAPGSLFIDRSAAIIRHRRGDRCDGPNIPAARRRRCRHRGPAGGLLGDRPSAVCWNSAGDGASWWSASTSSIVTARNAWVGEAGEPCTRMHAAQVSHCCRCGAANAAATTPTPTLPRCAPAGECHVTALVISDHVCENSQVARCPGGGRCVSRGRAG